MKRLLPLLLVLSLLSLGLAPQAGAAEASTAPRATDRLPGASVAHAVSSATGVAISPLLGTSAYGAYKWMIAKDAAVRHGLPWYAQPLFWGPALLLVGPCAAKDALGTILPGVLKKPLDLLEVFENKASALLAAGVVIPFALEAMEALTAGREVAAGAPSLASSGFAGIVLGAVDPAWLAGVLMVPFLLGVFALVWLASHAINVLIVLSPWGTVDAALKLARTAVLGLLVLAAAIDPWVGAAFSLALVVVAYFVAGWAFRLTTFGAIFGWETLAVRRSRFSVGPEDAALFAGGQLAGVPIRTYGRLVETGEGRLAFAYRPWLVGPARTAPVPAAAGELAVGRGAIFSDVRDGAGGELFVLPPRYRGHERVLAERYGFRGVTPAGLRKAWATLRALVGPAAPLPVPAALPPRALQA